MKNKRNRNKNKKHTSTPARWNREALDISDFYSVALLFAEYGFSTRDKEPLSGSQLHKELNRISSFIDGLPGRAEDKERIKPTMFQFIKDHGPPIWKDPALHDKFFDIVDMIIHPREAA